MFDRCLFCRREFGTNSTVEQFAVARRIAFDPARGRLWSVCLTCSRWSLAPIDTRWEIVEALEKLTRDQARLLGQTENIGLFVSGDAEIVRVGHASLREEAWWRYSREVDRRRMEAKRIIGRGKMTEAMITLFLLGFPLWGIRAPESWIERARRKRFGRFAWMGRAPCARCGATDQHIRFGDHVIVEAAKTEPANPVLYGYCRRCSRSDRGVFEIPGPVSGHVLRRSLAWENFSGVSQPVLTEAVRQIERTQTMQQFCAGVLRVRTSLKQMAPEPRIALEIAVNENRERELLALELRELEERWRQEEEIAAIVDGELTPSPRVG